MPDDWQSRLRRWLGRHSDTLDIFFSWAWNGWGEGGWLQAHAHSLIFARGLDRLRMPRVSHFHLGQDGGFAPVGTGRRPRRWVRH